MSASPAEPAEKAADPAANPGGDPVATKTTEPKSGLLSPGEGEKVELRLALPEGATYAVTTIGLLTLPGVQKPIGFAKREQISLSDCEGSGFTRACQLTQRITDYEAELPEGQPLANGEKPVLALSTRHRIDATGGREGVTSVEGEGAETPDARALAGAHSFYCLRLPSEPVGVGAMWADTCSMRTGGQVVTKHAKWELKKIADDPDGAGRRAELQMQAKYVSLDAEGNERVGVSRAMLYLWLDAGEPHLLREMIAMPLGAGGLKVKTSLHYQFAKVDPKDPEKVTRTDGQAFPGFRTLNDLEKDPGAVLEVDESEKAGAATPAGDTPK